MLYLESMTKLKEYRDNVKHLILYPGRVNSCHESMGMLRKIEDAEGAYEKMLKIHEIRSLE